MTRTHGHSHKHPLYERWKGMRARCNNPNHASYPRYGGRGIGVCARWNNFVLFLIDVEASCPGPSYDLHRLDNDGDYTPENCVWLEKREHMAQPKSPEHRAKIGAAHRGRKQSPAHAAANGRAHRTEIDPDWLRGAYGAGAPVPELAAIVGCSRSTIYLALKRAGIPTWRASVDAGGRR
jgi:hypothetical protein